MRMVAVMAFAASLVASSGVADEAHPLGAPRDDLARFYGIYGTPGDEFGRDYLVAPAEAPMGRELRIPEGYLMIVARWGDVAPWYMAATGDTRFERRMRGDFGSAAVVSFETGPDGQAEALILETSPDDRDRLDRLDDLPASN